MSGNCPACDQPVGEGARFCRACGQPVGDRDAVTVRERVPPVGLPRGGTESSDRSTRTRWLVLGAGIALVLAASATTVVMLSRDVGDSRSGDSGSPALSETGEHGLTSWRVIEEVEIPYGGVDVAVVGDSVWVTNGNVLHRVERATMTVVDAVEMIGAAYNVAASPESVWVVNNRPFEEVLRVDASTGAASEAESIPLPNDVDVDADGAWVLGGSSCARLDFATAGITLECDVGGEAIDAVTGDVWIVGDGLSRIDPQTGAVIGHLPLPGTGTAVSATGDAVWVVADTRSRLELLRIDPAALAITDVVDVGSVPDDGFPQGLSATEADVWLTNTRDGTLIHVDPETAAVTQTLRVGTEPRGVAASEEEVWVADSAVGPDGETGVIHLVTAGPGD